jgi:hypothetical protein
MVLSSCNQNVIVIEDHTGESNGPVFISIALSESNLQAARKNKLVLVEIKDQKEREEIPVQIDERSQGFVVILPEGQLGERKFKVKIKDSPVLSKMKAEENTGNLQAVLSEGNQLILQYNYQTVHEDEVVRPGGKTIEMEFSEMSSGPYYEEYLKSHPTFPRDTVVTSRIYSVPRSDYIHPVYGFDGEILTRDWPDGGHPHHRGIFWAWPEVQYNGEWGDIYALQRVFARPTGKIEYINGPVYAQIHAENHWIWEEEPIVREQVTIRAYQTNNEQRIIDLKLEFRALKENITLATRFTDSYGGLNIRMQTPEEQEISYFTDKPGSEPLRAWGDFNGIFDGSKEKSGLMILQHRSNPEYPGEWVEYPNLSWIQPTFPTPNTRFPLSTTEPLVLKYRFVIHKGGKPTHQKAEAYWNAYNTQVSDTLKVSDNFAPLDQKFGKIRTNEKL